MARQHGWALQWGNSSDDRLYCVSASAAEKSQLAELVFYVDFFTKERKIGFWGFWQKILIFYFQNAPMD